MNKETIDKEPEYDSPHDSEWIIGVDQWHNVFVIKAPNINPALLEFQNAEEIGIPFEMTDEKPGVYIMRCSYSESHDCESGLVDDWQFECEELTTVIEYT